MAEKDAHGKMPEVESVSIDIARDRLGDLVLRVGFGHERIVMTRHGKPTAALVSIRDLERLADLDQQAA